MTKPMKTEHLPSGSHGHNLPKDHPMHPDHGNPHHTPGPTPDPTTPPVSGTAAVSKARVMKAPPVHHKLTPEEQAAGKTPNSGKLKKDGSIVPGQDAAHDAERAAERAAEAAGGVDDGDTPDVTPEPTATPAPTAF